MNGPGSIEIAPSGKKRSVANCLPVQASSMVGKRLQEFLLQLPLNSFLAGISRSNLLKVARCRQILTKIPTFSDKSISLLGKS